MPKANVGIFIFDMVELLDFAGPFEVFSRTRLIPGVESRRSEESAPLYIFTVSKSDKLIVTTGGLRIAPHFCFEAAPPIDLLVIPGGLGTRSLLTDKTTLDWIRTTAAQAKRVTSVCTGSLLLASAGVLNGKRATTHWGALDLLQQISDSLHASVHVERSARVVDDGVITSAGISAGIDMSFYVVEQIFGKEVADETAHYMEYSRRLTL